MKLIIYISEQEYNECKNLFNMVYQEGYLNYNLNTALIMYITNGTPLIEELEKIIIEIGNIEETKTYNGNIVFKNPKEIKDEVMELLDNYISELKGENE